MDEAIGEIIDMMEEERMIGEDKLKDISYASILTMWLQIFIKNL